MACGLQHHLVVAGKHCSCTCSLHLRLHIYSPLITRFKDRDIGTGWGWEGCQDSRDISLVTIKSLASSSSGEPYPNNLLLCFVSPGVAEQVWLPASCRPSNRTATDPGGTVQGYYCHAAVWRPGDHWHPGLVFQEPPGGSLVQSGLCQHGHTHPSYSGPCN